MSTHQKHYGPLFAPAWHRPWLRYADTVDGADGTPAPKDEDLGFPKDTPVADMAPEQAVAYWKNQSKVQQSAREAAERKAGAYEKFGSVEDLQSAADAAEQARLDALGENDRALETARTEAHAKGVQEGAGKHLAAAVTGMLIAHVKGAQESFEDASKRVSGAIQFADLNKFIGDDGALDAAKVQTFAQSIGSTDGGGNGAQGGYDLLGSMQRQVTPQPGATGSVAQMEQGIYDRLTSNKQ